jgi:hypothetical protein
MQFQREDFGALNGQARNLRFLLVDDIATNHEAIKG